MIDFFLSAWRPVIEIVVIWSLLYFVIRFVQGTRAMQVMIGLVILVVLFLAAKFLELNSIIWVMSKLFAVGVVAVLIIFQPELRRALARIGTTMSVAFLKKSGLLDEVVRACDQMSRQRIGALIAIEREVGLKNYIESGIGIDAKISAELLTTIFSPSTVTHDGGVIVVGDRIASCGSLFPLSQNMELARALGTRHRAAVGLTEESDAVCVIVSEERGVISIAVYGKLTRDLDSEGAKRVLLSLFRPTEKKQTLTEFVTKNWNLFRGKARR